MKSRVKNPPWFRPRKTRLPAPLNLSSVGGMRAQKLRREILAVPVILILLAVATSPFTGGILIKREASLIVDDTLAGLQSSGETMLNVSSSFVQTLDALHSDNESQRRQLLQQIEKNSQEVDSFLQGYATSVTDREDQENLKQLVERRKRYRATRSEVLGLAVQGNLPLARQLFQSRLLPQYRDYAQALDTVVRYNIDQAKQRGARITRFCSLFQNIQGALLIFFAIYAFLVPLLMFLDRMRTREVVADV